MPRVTVAIPTRNRARWLPGAMASVLAQDFEDLALVVSDNASTDATPDVVRSFDDPRVSYLRHDEDVGILRNHNGLFERIATDYLLVLPDDDLLRPDHLARTVAVLDSHPAAGMAHTAFDVTDDDGSVVRAGDDWTYGLTADTVETGATFLRESMRHSCRVCASTALTRTAALPPGLFQPADFPAIDLGMWLRMALDWEMAYVAAPLGSYRIHGDSHSAAVSASTLAAGYSPDFDHIDQLLALKLRFLDTHAGRLGDVAGLRREAHGGRRLGLYAYARNHSLPERRLGPTARAIGAAVRHEPRLAAEPDVWKLLAASVPVARRAVRARTGTAG